MEDTNSSSSSASAFHIRINNQSNNNDTIIDNIQNEDSLLNDIYSIENNCLSGYDSPVTISLNGSNSNPNSQYNSDHEDNYYASDSSNNFISYDKKTLSFVKFFEVEYLKSIKTSNFFLFTLTRF